MIKLQLPIWLFLFTGILSIVLKGPKITRYNPCGLGVVFLDKDANENHWMGSVNLDLAPEFMSVNNASNSEVIIAINFKNIVGFSMVTPQAKLISTVVNSTSVTMETEGPLQNKYKFLVNTSNDEDMPYITEFKLNNRTLCNDFVRTKLGDQFESDSDGCGLRSLNHTELYTIGSEAKRGEWPWHVALFVKPMDNLAASSYECGGTIISRTAVITAAHCLEVNGTMIDIKRFFVLAGTNSMIDFWSDGVQLINAQGVVIHPAYDYERSKSDLAIIKVPGFKFTNYVRPVCLGRPSAANEELSGRFAMIVGFGLTEANTKPEIMRSGSTMIQSDKTCKDYSGLYTFLLNESTFCAGYGPDGGSTFRNGDSGGGLVMSVLQNDTIAWLLTGVSSKCLFGKEAVHCQPDYYVTYTNTLKSDTFDWIQQHGDIMQSRPLGAFVDSASVQEIKGFTKSIKKENK